VRRRRDEATFVRESAVEYIPIDSAGLTSSTEANAGTLTTNMIFSTLRRHPGSVGLPSIVPGALTTCQQLADANI
jgi:hypothetical protein